MQVRGGNGILIKSHRNRPGLVRGKKKQNPKLRELHSLYANVDTKCKAEAWHGLTEILMATQS